MYSLRNRVVSVHTSGSPKRRPKRPSGSLTDPEKKKKRKEPIEKEHPDNIKDGGLDLSEFSYTHGPPTSSATTVHKKIWEPKHWQEQLDNIKAMRASRSAPVDHIGASKLPEPAAVPQTRRYQVLISLMLSSQTKDEVTSSAMSRLKAHGLTVESINSTPQKDIEDMIKPVGFYRRKAEYIKKATKLLSDKYKGDIPPTLDGILSLPGVGPKMAHLCMDIAWDSVTGIGVDTHVHRISNRLKWTKNPTKDPEETRKALEEWLPKTEWSDVNWLLVGFGQQTCLPVSPKCTECLNKDICPSSNVTKKH